MAERYVVVTIQTTVRRYEVEAASEDAAWRIWSGHSRGRLLEVSTEDEEVDHVRLPL